MANEAVSPSPLSEDSVDDRSHIELQKLLRLRRQAHFGGGQTMSEVSSLLNANESYAKGFTKGDLPLPPSRHVAALVCMDARLDPAKFLGLQEGDAHVIRNAGGRASPDALRSLIISQKLLGTKEFVVVHHTDCGMQTFTNEQLRERLSREAHSDASSIDFLPFRDLEESVREDVRTIRSSPFIPRDVPVTGFVYDVRTGELREVK